MMPFLLSKLLSRVGNVPRGLRFVLIFRSSLQAPAAIQRYPLNKAEATP